MLKKSPSRNQRSKGIKTKHVLQICLLLAVCFWLIYQVKRSHDKRKEFGEKDVKASLKVQSDDVILQFGRKDLPHVQDVSKNYKHEEEEEEEDGVEEKKKHDEELEEKAKILEEEEQEGASEHEEEEQEEGSKHEEEDQEEVREDEGSKHDDEEQEAEIKDEEAEDEGKGDDEVDENEQEKVDGEADHEEEFLDEEKEGEAEGDDKENVEKENEEKEGEESDDLVNDPNHDGGGRNAHEAREEHYKADDASSAVSHDAQIINSEADKLDMENSNDNSTMNVLEPESKANTTREINGDENELELKVDEGKDSEGGRSFNVTHTKENEHETGSSNSVYISLPNTTNITDFIDRASNNSSEVSKETSNNPAGVNKEIPGSLQNGTSARNTAEDGMVTEEKYSHDNEMISNNKQPDFNRVDSSKIENVATTDSSNSSTDTGFGMSEDIVKINGIAGGDSFRASMTKEITDSTQNEKSGGDNESVGTDESSDNSSSNKMVDGGQQDLIDSSENTLPKDEKDARLDLSTLPDITTEGSNNEDAAAE